MLEQQALFDQAHQIVFLTGAGFRLPRGFPTFARPTGCTNKTKTQSTF